MIDLFYFDQSGFAPSLPSGYSWCRVGQRKLIRYEASQRRRVNVAGALAPYAAGGPELVFESRRSDQGRYDAATHLHFLARLGGLPDPLPLDWCRQKPCVVVMDNYSVHHSQPVKEQLPALEAAGVQCFFLPPYSPELNEIEPLWRQVKYQDLPDRSHLTALALQQAVEAALSTRADNYRKTTMNLHRSA
jgi:transposase